MKLINKIQNKIPYAIWAFLFPLAILTAVFAALHITPFGDKTLLFGDANGYYINYLSYFRTILSGEHSIFYSFSKDIGGNLAGYAWGYLLSPYTWLFCLAGWDYLDEIFTLSIMLMEALMGLSMYVCLGGIFEKKGSHLIFSTCYALCGFAVVNNYNIVFDCGLIMLPLMTLGLYKLMEERSSLLYILSLCYGVVTGIQCGFILCITSVLFFGVMFYSRNAVYKERRPSLCIRYAVSSILAGLLGAIVWLPVFLSYQGGRGSERSLSDFEFTGNFPILDFGARLFSGASSTTQLVDGLPAVFCSILVVALAILFFLNEKIEKKIRYSAGGTLLILFLSFYIKTITNVFQGFTHANWFNYRFSFVFSFVLIILAVMEMPYIEETPVVDLKRCGLLILVATILIFSKEYDFVSGGNAVFDLALLLVMAFGLVFRQNHPERATYLTLVLLLGVCTTLQLYANYYYSMRRVELGGWEKTATEFQDGIDAIEPLVEGIKTGDPEFYRLENDSPRSGMTDNDPQMFDYNGVGQGNTGERDFVAEGLGKLGVDHMSSWNWYDHGTTASMDSLLGIRYVLSTHDLSEEKGYEKKLSLGKLSIYKNPFVLPIAILSDKGVDEVSIEKETDVFAIQNEIWSALTGEDDALFTKASGLSYTIVNNSSDLHFTEKELEALPAPQKEGEDEESSSAELTEEDADAYRSYISFEFTAKQDGPVYCYNAAALTDGYGSQEDVLQYVGRFAKGEKVEGKIYSDELITKNYLAATANSLCVYYANEDVLAEYSALLQKRDMTIEKVSDSCLKGGLKAESDQKMVWTIPFDKGWKLYVDGKETLLDKTADLFLAADVSEGEHSYELRFVPVGLKLGGGISVIALLGIVVLVCLERKSKEKSDDSI